LTTNELAKNQISLEIAQKMSEIHSLDIPVIKEPEWLFLTLNRWLNNVDTILNDIRNNNDDASDTKNLPKKLSKVDFRNEVEWLKAVIEAANYPVVFCHNDLQEGNILLRERDFSPLDKTNSNGNELNALKDLNSEGHQSRKRSLVDNSLDSDFIDSTQVETDEMGNEKPELMIIDFEYCAYNYRAFDIANHFLGELKILIKKCTDFNFIECLEWTYDYSNDKFPFYHHLRENYPSSKQIDDFITIYLRKVSGNVLEQEKKQLIEEIALFTLASHLFWGIWGVVNVNQEIEFGYWNYANRRIEEYFKAKDEYLKQRPLIIRDISNREVK
jgi:choline/ethanolamine kinase